MDSRTLRLLELDKVLARLEAATACELGRARVRALKPSPDAEEARRRLAGTTEARRFLALKSPPFGGITDIAVLIKNASIGAMLDPAPLLSVGAFAGGARRLRESIVAAPRADFPILHGLATRITPRPDLEKAIAEAIDEATREVKDDASLDLLRARRNIRQTQAGIQTRLRGMLSDPNVQPHLQDAFVTLRDGRYCLPVRADSRARVPGIVHDRSGSGGAYFVEPQAVVEMNNRLRELMAEEREAIIAVLTALSQRVAGAEDDLRPAVEACAELDFAFAKAQLSESMNAIEPLLLGARREARGDGAEGAAPSEYALLQARHPLVENCVPNDIFLGGGRRGLGDRDGASPTPNSQLPTPEEGFDVMLITGPNTGGKTVVLKTLGLLALMTACGLHIPAAPGSRLNLPRAVFADIGDEQSIEQSLSTFSSHIKQIVAILNRAGAGDLVLLDEAGAGTDPDEGAALAKAVLRTLQRRGVQVVATTHYGELKQFALGAQRFQNASVEFDVRSLKPTYHLRIGVPGASNALDIAQRLGMPVDLVSRARRYLGRERAEAEVATQRLEETQRELTQQTRSAQRERDEVQLLRDDYEARLARLQEQMQTEREAAQREAVAVVQKAQEEADRILRELRLAARESKQTEEARGQLRALRDNVRGQSASGALGAGATDSGTSRAKGASLKAGKSRTATNGTAKFSGGLFDADEVADDMMVEGGATSAGEASTSVREPMKSVASGRRSSRSAAFPNVGDLVRVSGLDKEGVLLSAPDASGRVEVRIGAVKVQVAATSIESAAQQKTVGGVAAIKVRKSVNVAEEINLIGQNTGEALAQVEKYLDDALLADAKQVRIVHGKGTGALRTAIHRFLKSHRAISEFHLAPSNEGGEGATIAHLEAR